MKKSSPKKKKRVNGRKKGHNAERALVKQFETWWGSDFYRTPGSGSFATRGFSHQQMSLAGDIVTDDPRFPFCVESKKVEGWTLEQMLTSDKTKMHDWWAQTLKQCPANKIPMLVFTKNHSAKYVMMSDNLLYDADRRSDTGVCEITRRFYFRNALDDKHSVVIFAIDELFKTNGDLWIP